jgi:hypothetical protein
VQLRHGARLVGRWETEDDRVVAIWEYDDRATYERIKAAVSQDPDRSTSARASQEPPDHVHRPGGNLHELDDLRRPISERRYARAVHDDQSPHPEGSEDELTETPNLQGWVRRRGQKVGGL